MINNPLMKLIGRVVMEVFGKGSKSEHNAVYLDTGESRYRLKKRGGNPFYDESLQGLVGKTISAEGKLTGYFFEITGEIEVIGENIENKRKRK